MPLDSIKNNSYKSEIYNQSRENKNGLSKLMRAARSIRQSNNSPITVYPNPIVKEATQQYLEAGKFFESKEATDQKIIDSYAKESSNYNPFKIDSKKGLLHSLLKTALVINDISGSSSNGNIRAKHISSNTPSDSTNVPDIVNTDILNSKPNISYTPALINIEQKTNIKQTLSTKKSVNIMNGRINREKRNILNNASSDIPEQLYDYDVIDFINKMHKLSHRIPDVKEIASTSIKQALKENNHYNYNPDSLYFVRFDISDIEIDSYKNGQNLQSVKKHHQQPIYSGTLTETGIVQAQKDMRDLYGMMNDLCTIYTFDPKKHKGTWTNEGASSLTPQQFYDVMESVDIQKDYNQKVKDFWYENQLLFKELIQTSYEKFALYQLESGDLTIEQYNLAMKVFGSSEEYTLSQLDIYEYPSIDIILVEEKSSKEGVCFILGESSPFIPYSSRDQLREKILTKLRDKAFQDRFKHHFTLYNQQDGTSFSGVNSAIEGLLDGKWEKSYIAEKPVNIEGNLFEHLVFSSKESMLQDGDSTIKSKGEVERDYFLKVAGIVGGLIPALDIVAPELILPLQFGLTASQFGASVDKAINGDTTEERKDGTISAAMTGLATAAIVVPTISLGFNRISSIISRAENDLISGTKPLNINLPKIGRANQFDINGYTYHQIKILEAYSQSIDPEIGSIYQKCYEAGLSPEETHLILLERTNLTDQEKYNAASLDGIEYEEIKGKITEENPEFFPSTVRCKRTIGAGCSPSIAVDKQYYVIEQNKIRIKEEFDSSKVGIPLIHAEKMQQVAWRTNTIFGIRPVDSGVKTLIEEGYPTKDIRVKGKSSNWGPQNGFICIKQMFSKKEGNLAVIEKQNQAIQTGLSKKHFSQTTLSISQTRINELKELGSLQIVSKESNGNLILRSVADREGQSHNTYEFTAKINQKNSNMYDIYHRTNDGTGNILEEAMLVVAEPILNEPLTADYDLFLVSPKKEDFGQLDQRIVSPDERVDPIYKKNPGKPLGAISQRVKGLMNQINIELNRGPLRSMVHHGEDAGNPASDMNDNFPATFYLPKKMQGHVNGEFIELESVVVVKNLDEYKKLISVIKENGFHFTDNPTWEKVNAPSFNAAKEKFENNADTNMKPGKSSQRDDKG